ncbi:MAG: hypothetical protein PHH60_00270, partial [Candidatus Margulisbacteria bacterium]|nr:hypothetical protein [Candidatus Margulisiibacteriota bacterium]
MGETERLSGTPQCHWTPDAQTGEDVLVCDYETAPAEELPQVDTAPVISPAEPTATEQVLTRDQALAFLHSILGAEVTISEDKIDCLILFINRTLYHQDSTTLTQATIDKINSEDNEALRDFIRFYSLGRLSEIEGVEATPTAGALTDQSASLEDLTTLTSEVLSGGILPPAVLQAIHDGTLQIKVRFTQNRQGQFDNFAVILQSRNHEEIIADYRNGEFVSGNPPATALARGVIAYLQRLLRGNTANQYTFAEEGVFDRQTLEAMYTYLSRENLLTTSFDSASLQQVLDQRIQEADEAAASFQTAPTADMAALNHVLTLHQDYLTLKGDLEIQYHTTIIVADGSSLENNSDNEATSLSPLSAEDRQRFHAARQAYLDAMEQFGGRQAFNRALSDANLRYRMAQDSLNDMLATIEFASRYRDIDLNSDNLSEQDRAFIQACRDAADRYQPIVEQILGEILDEQNGLMLLDIRAYRHSLVEYQHALQRNNERKQSEALDRFSSQAYRILSLLRRWENSAQRDPELNQTLSQYTTNLGSRLRSEISNRLPPTENQHLQDQLSMIDQVVLTQIEGDRSVDSLSLEQIRARYARAASLSDTLGSGPARDMIIAFLQDSLRERDFADIQQLFNFFGGVADAASLETDCRNILQNNVMDSFGLSGGPSGNTTARAYLANNMVGRSMDSSLNRMMQLASNLYYLMSQYNQYADSAEGRERGAQPLTFSDIIGTAREFLGGLRGEDGNFLPVGEANAILRILSRTTDNADIARIEIAQQRDEALNNFYLRDHRQLRGGNEITFTPRAIRELEGDFTQNATPNGLISYEDIQRWASPELLATLPPDAQTGDWFYISTEGIQRVTPTQLAELESLPRIPVNNLEGTRYERRPMEFLHNEVLAVLKLAISSSRYGPISDRQVLMLDGAVTARMIDVDLLSTNTVFGEAARWTLHTQAQTLSLQEIGAFNALANAIAGNDSSSRIPELLRRLTSGSSDVTFSDFTNEEKHLLEDWLDTAFPENVGDLDRSLAERYPTLDQDQRATLRTAVSWAFGEVARWIFRPGSLTLNGLESNSLLAIAGTMQNSDPHSLLPAVLRRIATGGGAEIRLTDTEKQLLEEWLNDTFPAGATNLGQLIAQRFPTLDQTQREALRTAVGRLHYGVNNLQRKHGLNHDQQATLSSLAGYLAWANELPEDDPLRRAIAIYDARLVDEDPPEELVNALREAAGRLGHTFDEQAFRDTYGESIRILRYLHRTLEILASKYEPEEPGWEGPLDLLGRQRIRQIVDAGAEALHSANPISYLASGVPDEMTFITNLLIYSRPGENNDIVDELARLNPEIESLRDQLNIELEEFGRHLTDQNHEDNPLVGAVRECQGLVGQNAALRASLTRILRNQGRQAGEPLLGEDDRNRQYLTSFLGLLDDIETDYDRTPSNYIAGADSLMERALLQLEEVEAAIEAESNDQEKQVLIRIRDSLRQIIGPDDSSYGLRGLIRTRSEQLPRFAALTEALTRRQEIMDILGSDHFDREKFELMRSSGNFDQLLSQQGLGARALDWAGNTFSGQTSEVNGPEGNTEQTIFEILSEFFVNNPNGSIDLSNLLPEPGEDAGILTAKIAISQLISSIPPEQYLNLPSVLPVMTAGWFHATHGIFSPVRDIPAFLGGVTGFGDIQIGPDNFREMLEDANSPIRRNFDRFLSFMALASNSHPRMNMSSQVYMLMARSQREGVRQHLYQHLGSADWRTAETLPMNRLDRATMEAFLEYVSQELLPQLDNPAIQQWIEEQYSQNKIPFTLEQLRALSNEQTRREFLDALPDDGNFAVFDSDHADDETRPAAQLVETVLRVVGKISMMRAVENVSLYSMTSFDPIQERESNWLSYLTGNHSEPTRTVPVIRYSDNPDVGEVRNAGYGLPILSNLETLGTDACDFAQLHDPAAVAEGMWDEFWGDGPRSWSWNEGPLDFTTDTAIGFGSSYVSLNLTMARQIEMGFTGTARGLGEFASAVASGNRSRMIHALEAVVKGISDTTGGFVVYEFLPAVFYAEVLNEIENENYDTALGKAVAITMLTVRSLRTTFDAVNYLIRRGHATIENGVLRIRNRAEAARIYEQRMRVVNDLYQRSFEGRLGFRLLNGQFNPFAWVNGIRRAVSYRAGNLEFQIAPSDVQMRVTEAVTDNPSTWESVTRTRPEITRWLRSANNGFSLVRRLADNFASSTAGESFSGTSALENLLLASRRLGTSFTLTIGRGGSGLIDLGVSDQAYRELSQARSIRDYETFRRIMVEHHTASGQTYTEQSIKVLYNNFEVRGQIVFGEENYLRLARARADGDYSRFRQIVEQHGLDTGHGYSQGSIEQMYNAFEPVGESYISIREMLDPVVDPMLQPGYQPPADVFDPRGFLEEAIEGRGLKSRITIEVNGQIHKVTGQQVLEILHNQLVRAPQSLRRVPSVISEQVDAQVAHLFRPTVHAHDMYNMIKSIGRRYLGRGVIGLAIQAGRGLGGSRGELTTTPQTSETPDLPPPEEVVDLLPEDVELVEERPAETTTEFVDGTYAGKFFWEHNIDFGELNGSFRDVTGNDIAAFTGRLSELGVTSFYVEPGTEIDALRMNAIVSKLESTGMSSAGSSSKMIIVRSDPVAGVALEQLPSDGVYVEQVITDGRANYVFRDAVTGAVLEQASVVDATREIAEVSTEAKETVVPEKLVESGKMTEMEGSVRVGAASPGVIGNTAKMGATGFIVEIPVSIIRQKIHGKFSVEQTMNDALNAGKGWVGFGALQGSAMKYLGYYQTGGMVFA